MLSSIVTHAPPNLKIKRVIKVLGMVNATPEFGDHPYVINGFSELMEIQRRPPVGGGLHNPILGWEKL